MSSTVSSLAPEDEVALPREQALSYGYALVVTCRDDPPSDLVAMLESTGFECAVADQADATAAVRDTAPTLVLATDGCNIDVVREVRTVTDGYVIVIVTDASEAAVVEALDAGADDVAASARPGELRARLSALLRRRRRMQHRTEDGWVVHRSLHLHPPSRRALLDGEPLDLTRSEFNILEAMLHNPTRVTSKTEIALRLRGLYGVPTGPVSTHDVHAVEVHLANLRRKLGDDPRSPRWLETVRGVGYRVVR